MAKKRFSPEQAAATLRQVKRSANPADSRRSGARRKSRDVNAGSAQVLQAAGDIGEVQCLLY
jgi:hypothetical protein